MIGNYRTMSTGLCVAAALVLALAATRAQADVRPAAMDDFRFEAYSKAFDLKTALEPLEDGDAAGFMAGPVVAFKVAAEAARADLARLFPKGSDEAQLKGALTAFGSVCKEPDRKRNAFFCVYEDNFAQTESLKVVWYVAVDGKAERIQIDQQFHHKTNQLERSGPKEGFRFEDHVKLETENEAIDSASKDLSRYLPLGASRDDVEGFLQSRGAKCFAATEKPLLLACRYRHPHPSLVLGSYRWNVLVSFDEAEALSDFQVKIRFQLL